MAEKDRLTGLMTDQYLRGDLDMEFQRARRFNRELSFILLEPLIDDAARADMLYTVLKGLARSTDALIRDIDIAVRWGQQVLLVLPETGRSGAETVEGKVRENFSQLQFKHPETGAEIAVSVRSVVIVFPHDGADKETVLYNLREGIQSAAQGG
jgi:diguanylate cyclase (GGDEF)-like protein